MKTKYRIITDKYCGYGAQFKPWYFPFIWQNCFIFNTRSTIEEARDAIRRHRMKIEVLEEL